MKDRLGADDLFDLKFLRDARLSPDGTKAASVVSWTGESEHFEIAICELKTSRWTRLAYDGNAIWPRWSPDGRWLAFVGDGRLRLADMNSGHIGEPLTPEGHAVQGAPSWSPDSERMAVSLLRHRRASGVRRITTAAFRAEGIGFIDGIEQRIELVSRTGGEGQVLTGAREGMCHSPEWSPCGRRILFFSTDNAVPIASYSPRLMRAEVTGGGVNEILGQGWYITAARWLPDGMRIAVSAAHNSSLTIPNATLWVVDLNGRAEQRTPGLAGKIGGVLHHDMPAWELTRGNVLTVLDHTTAYITVLTRGSYHIWRVSLTGDIDIQPMLVGARSCLVLDAHAATQTLLYALTDLRAPPEVCVSDLAGQSERKISHLNDAVLATWPKVEVEHFTYRSHDGLELEAWFMAPRGRVGAIPTILFIHGGPFAAMGQIFRYDFLMLISRGFGVLFHNFRGSAGYGDDFSRLIMGDWGGLGFPDHMAAADAAIARGFADPDRMGVWGPSHGGFATCWVVGHTARFKAAVAEAASTNRATAYYLTDAPDTIALDMGGRPHEIPEVYRARSPITYAHHCRTPTMFIHGENDLRCPISEAEQFYRVLLDVGCDTAMVRIPDCNHMGDSSGPLAARRAQNDALLDWFGRHL